MIHCGPTPHQWVVVSWQSYSELDYFQESVPVEQRLLNRLRFSAWVSQAAPRSSLYLPIPSCSQPQRRKWGTARQRGLDRGTHRKLCVVALLSLVAAAGATNRSLPWYRGHVPWRKPVTRTGPWPISVVEVKLAKLERRSQEDHGKTWWSKRKKKNCCRMKGEM